MLAVVNALLATVAVLSLYFRQQLVGSHWMDLVRGAFDRYADTFSTGMLVLGCVLLSLVVFGSIVTFLRARKLLVVYGMWLTLTLVMMVFLIVSAFQVHNEASKWRRQQYSNDPTVDGSSSKSVDEDLVAKHFNALYCDAQQAYFCDHATLKELLEFGLGNLTLSSTPEVASTNSSSEVTRSSEEIAVLCSQSQDSNSSTTMSSDWSQLCAYCRKQQGGYEEFKSIITWSTKSCGFSSSTTAFCSSSNAANATDPLTAAYGHDVGAESPYSSCRAKLLQETTTWSERFGIAWSVAGFLLILLLIFVVLLLRTHDHAEALDLDDVEDSDSVYEKA